MAGNFLIHSARLKIEKLFLIELRNGRAVRGFDIIGENF